MTPHEMWVTVERQLKSLPEVGLQNSPRNSSPDLEVFIGYYRLGVILNALDNVVDASRIVRRHCPTSSILDLEEAALIRQLWTSL